jgi:hypothetical protein
MSEIVPNFRLTAALEYAAMGWLVIPLHWPRIGPNGPTGCSCSTRADCSSIGKHPLTENGLKSASADEAIVRGWWAKWPQANVGVVTGAGSGIVVLDEDPRDGGDVSMVDLASQHGPMPVTSEVETGGGGRHLIFAHPGKPVRNSAGRVGKGIDVRGDGGYVVAPPSLHQSGQRYTWGERGHPQDTPPAAVPPWLLSMMVEPPRAAQSPTRPVDQGRKWLGEALARTNGGSRNDVGWWLACQLRDNGMSQFDAESLMLEYARRCPQPSDRPPYSDREARASMQSAYATPPRGPAKSADARSPAPRPAAPTKQNPPASGAAGELNDHIENIIAGRVANVPLPWPLLTKLTQSLLNGCVATVCGDPGVGKTFWTLQALQFWTGNDVSASVFFVEKDRKFHTLRLLAQLESDGRYVDTDWVRDHADQVRVAMNRNAGMIDMLGTRIWSEPIERLTLDKLLGWTRDRAKEGTRVLVIDPITAADAGTERWRVDDDFMIRTQQILTEHGASLLLITHPKKGNRPGAPTGHDQAGGAAYHRFADTNIWLYRPRARERQPAAPENDERPRRAPPPPLTDARLAEIRAQGELYADGRCGGPDMLMLLNLQEYRAMARELTERRATDEPARTEAVAR